MWTAPRDWAGEAAHILAGGPSAKREDLAGLTRIVAINSAWKTAPHAEFLFFGDLRWWTEIHQRGTDRFQGIAVTGQKTVVQGRAYHCLGKRHPPGLSDDPAVVSFRYSSVTGAINLLAHMGVSGIRIFGLDGEVNGRRHNHDDRYPWPLKDGCFDLHDAEFHSILPCLSRRGIEVVNMNPASRITAFRKVDRMEFDSAVTIAEPKKPKFEPLVCRSGRTPSQRADELRPFIAFLKREKVKSYLEIGARHGDTFFDVMSALPKGSKGVAVDLAGGPWGTPKSRQSLIDAVAELNAQGYRASIVWGDSQTSQVRQTVMARGPFDAALIDGDHRLPGVTSDWKNYGPMARLVAFHDIVGHGQTSRDGKRMPIEVPALWASLKVDHKVREFVGQDSAMGIGVVIGEK